MGLLGFSVSLFIGLVVDNPFITVVTRSLYMLLLFTILGAILSVLGQKVIEEHFESLKAQAMSKEEGHEPVAETAEAEIQSEDISQDIPVGETAGA